MGANVERFCLAEVLKTEETHTKEKPLHLLPILIQQCHSFIPITLRVASQISPLFNLLQSLLMDTISLRCNQSPNHLVFVPLEAIDNYRFCNLFLSLSLKQSKNNYNNSRLWIDDFSAQLPDLVPHTSDNFYLNLFTCMPQLLNTSRLFLMVMVHLILWIPQFIIPSEYLSFTLGEGFSFFFLPQKYLLVRQFSTRTKDRCTVWSWNRFRVCLLCGSLPG